MRQIIAFDGCDGIGKTTIINKLVENLNDSNFNTFVFHLTGPGDEQDFIQSFDNISNVSTTVTQYLKFYELFKAIKVIISSNPNNIVILDRTPYSEYIWTKFFGRNGIDSARIFNNNMFKAFQQINSSMLYVSLNVDTEILTDRILTQEQDRKNFLTAFDKIYKQNNMIYTGDMDTCKVLFMVQWIKNSYKELELELTKNNIFVKEFNNNVLDNINDTISLIILSL